MEPEKHQNKPENPPDPRRKQLRDAQRRHVAKRKKRGLELTPIFLPSDKVAEDRQMAEKMGITKDELIRKIYLHGRMTFSLDKIPRTDPTVAVPVARHKTDASSRQYELLKKEDINELRKERNKCHRKAAALQALLPDGHPFRNRQCGRGKNIAERSPNWIKRKGESDTEIETKKKKIRTTLREQAKGWIARCDQVREELIRLKIDVP